MERWCLRGAAEGPGAPWRCPTYRRPNSVQIPQLGWGTRWLVPRWALGPSTLGMPCYRTTHSLTTSCRYQALKVPGRSDQASGPLWQWHGRLGEVGGSQGA